MKDLVSHLKHEKRYFSLYRTLQSLTTNTTIPYDYNLAGNLTSITDPFGDSFSYTRNAQGQLKTVTGSPYAGWTSYVPNVTYRAWGAPKGVSYVERTQQFGSTRECNDQIAVWARQPSSTDWT